MIKLTNISNHIRCINLSIIKTIKFHQLMLRARCSVKFLLSGRDYDLNWFQLAGELFLTQTQTYPRQGSLRSPLLQLKSNSWVQSAPHNQGRPAARTIRTTLPLGSRLAPHTSLLPLVCALSLTGSRPKFSYSASRSEQVIWPTKC